MSKITIKINTILRSEKIFRQCRANINDVLHDFIRLKNEKLHFFERRRGLRPKMSTPFDSTAKNTLKKMGPKIQKNFLFILHQFEIRVFAISKFFSASRAGSAKFLSFGRKLSFRVVKNEG